MQGPCLRAPSGAATEVVSTNCPDFVSPLILSRRKVCLIVDRSSSGLRARKHVLG